MSNEGLTFPRGFQAGAVAADIRGKGDGRLDLALLFSETPCNAAGLFTTSAFRSPTVVLTNTNLRNGRLRGVVANSGCANAYVGEQGMRDARQMAEMAADKLGIDAGEVAVASTGVTGVAMPMERIETALPRIALDPAGGVVFAKAVMTTDTVVKQAQTTLTVDGRECRIGGCAKGAGMIHPNLATMLSFLTTDATVEGGFLKRALQQAADLSFNMLTVDGDTSPNDTLLILANGAAGAPPVGEGGEAASAFQQALADVCVQLAIQLARDAEGATKVIEVQVSGTASIAEARCAARIVAGSPLVKSAVHGNDPNWGRVIAAVARSGVQVDEAKTSLTWQGVRLFDGSNPVPFDKQALSRLTQTDEVRIEVNLGVGDSSATAWGCDLSAEYVKINAEYTT